MNARTEKRIQRNRRLELMFGMYCQLQGRHGCISDIARYFKITPVAVSKLCSRHRWEERYEKCRDEFVTAKDGVVIRAMEMHLAAIDALIQNVLNNIVEFGFPMTLENLEKLLSIRKQITLIGGDKTDDPESQLVSATTNNIQNFFGDIPESQRRQLDTDASSVLGKLAERSAPVRIFETA